MEAIGKVNCYVCTGCKSRLLTINLNTGTTPFMIGCKSCGKMRESCYYRLGDLTVTVKEAFYRLLPSFFNEATPGMRDHLLNGGLINSPLNQFERVLDPADVKDWTIYLKGLYGVETG